MRIVVLSPSFSRSKILRSELLKYFPDSVFNENNRHYQGDELVEFVKHAEGIIVGTERLDAPLLKQIRNVKILSKYGVGLDGIDVDYCGQNNISLGWTPGVNKLSVAEMTIAFMLMLSRNLYTHSNLLKLRKWEKSGGSNLSGKTVGIIGAGNIGKEVVRLLQPFGCKILVNDIIDQKEFYRKLGVMEATKNEIYENGDFVTVHTPLTAQTKHLINREALKKMKSTAFLINTARGGIVNQEDLKESLKNHIIAGAAIDVYESEPPVDEDLLHIPNLICTPHIGGNSAESVLAMGRSAIRHLKDFFLT